MTVTADQRAVIQEAARQELARRDLMDFGLRVFPGFKDPPHVRKMAEYLKRLLRGEIRRLILACSVRHSKSTLGSQIMPAFFVGENPTQEVVLASYSADLAERDGRIAKSLVESTLWPFPDVRLSSDSKAVSRWNVVQGGGCRSIGVGGGITGHGADLLVISDPHATASSDADRESAWTWYQETITPRLNAGARVCLSTARMHDSDLVGRILESGEADKWTVLRLPAICDSEDDPLGRAIGDALWAEHMSAEEIESRRVAMGSAAWSAQFQQCPVPASGAIFRREWLEHQYDALPKSEPISPELAQIVGPSEAARRMRCNPVIVTGIDCASKTAIHNDYSAIVTIAFDGRDYYIIDVVRERLEFPALIRRVQEVYWRHKPSTLYIEEASAGIQVVQVLKAATGLPVVGVTPRGSKITRAEGIVPLFESGRVKIPSYASWLDVLREELLRFPHGKHDDALDALCLAVYNARLRSRARVDWSMNHMSLMAR